MRFVENFDERIYLPPVSVSFILTPTRNGTVIFKSILCRLGFLHILAIPMGHILGLQSRIGPLWNIDGLKILPEQIYGVILLMLQQLGGIGLSKGNQYTALQIVNQCAVSFFIMDNHVLIREAPLQMGLQQWQLIMIRRKTGIKSERRNLLKTQKPFHMLKLSSYFMAIIFYLPDNGMMLGTIDAGSLCVAEPQIAQAQPVAVRQLAEIQQIEVV